MSWRFGLSLTIIACCILGRACSNIPHSMPEEALNRVIRAWKQKVSSKRHIPRESERLDNEIAKVIDRYGGSRMLQPFADTTGCGDVLIEVGADSALNFFTDAFNIIFEDDPAFGNFVFVSIQAFVTFGFQGRRVCASCSEYEFLRDGPTTSYCHPDAYGANTKSSGLVLFPLTNSTLAPGTFPAYIFSHGSRTSDAPSFIVDGVRSIDELVIFSFLPAAFGFVGLEPDYMGYGIGRETLYKGYLIKQSYQTSIIPLWFKSDEMLQADSNCASAMADAAVLAGYSEGGYTSIVLATTLYALGVEIIGLFTGGSPVNIQVTVPELVVSVESGAYPPRFYDALALFGSAYSSTYPQIANFNKSQNVLNEAFRDIMVQAVFEGMNRTTVNALFPPNATDAFDPELISWSRQVVARGEPYPCNTSLIPGENDFLCRAEEENNLIAELLSVRFPTTLCHTVDDEVVSFRNLPNVSENDNITLSLHAGTHSETAPVCLFQSLLALGDPTVQNFAMTDKHTLDGCPSREPSTTPSVSPGTPSFSPSKPTEESLAFSLSPSSILHALLLGVVALLS